MDSSLVPEAVINPSATEGPLPLSVTLDGTDSVDPTGNGLTYDWDLNGDGTYGDSSSPAPVLNLTTATNVTVGLKVTTTAGTSDTATVTLYPGNSAPTIDLDVTSPLPWKAGDIIEFNLTANDPDGPLPAGAVEWFTELEHCYSLEDCHNHPVEEGTSLSGSLEGPSHEYPSFLRVTASVTDSRGQKTTISQQLQPESSNLTVNGQPTNLAVVIGSDTYQTPETVEMITGSNITVSAVTPQVIGGVSHVFGFWSDGGTASHSVVVDNDKTIKLTMLFG
jgi:VCBS repeat-containing protein